MSSSKNIINRDENKVLFNLPVTKQWIDQLVVSLALTCHSSERGILEHLRDVFDYKISSGNIHNILSRAIAKAKEINNQEDLSAVKIGAHDEIFQGRKPILVGSCAQTSYCYLLSQEDSRDGDTWGFHLLELQNKGLLPDHTVADGGQGLRAGQAEVLPSVPCFGDIFHALQDLGRVSIYQNNRAIGLIGKLYDLEAKMKRAKKHNKGNQLSRKLASVRIAEEKAIYVADSLTILCEWMQKDILALIGPNLETRRILFDFVIQELQKLEPFGSSHIKKVRCKLENQRENLLMFVDKIDQELNTVAVKFDVQLLVVRRFFEMQAIPYEEQHRWIEDKEHRGRFGALYYPIQQAIEAIIEGTVRASSIIENLNSRLRNYFFLRKQFKQGSLDLLRFFLNHKIFLRSEHDDRVGKSPAELLSGKSHPHWLEMLGFIRFKQVPA